MANEVSKAPSVWSSIDVQVQFDGRHITLPNSPEKMPYPEARAILKRIEDAENQAYDLLEVVVGAPWDALVAVTKAMQKIYGVVLATSHMTFFGEIRPQLVTINVGPLDTDRIQVAQGKMQLPNIKQPLFVTMVQEGVRIQTSCNRADREKVIEIVNTARALMREESIYKRQAIRLPVTEEGDIALTAQPEFLDLQHVSESDMIHTEETLALIRTNIFSPLKNTEQARRHRIPLKRGVLLTGRYGTGKSLTARVAAKVAIDNNWTFIILDRAQGLESAINFAKTYQPCVIFAEDIDRVAEDRGEEEVNDLINTFDGVVTKDMEMMIVLTTNFIEKIDKAMLRPGRFDAVIKIQEPDAKTAIKLVKAYARDLLAVDADLGTIGEELAGNIPATIREVVERSKLSMLLDGREKLVPADLYASAVGMRHHMELLADKNEGETLAERFTKAFMDVMTAAALGDVEGTLAGNIETVGNTLDSFRENVLQRFNIVDENVGVVRSFALGAGEAANEALGNTEMILKRVSR